MKVLVFKTNVQNKSQSIKLIEVLTGIFPKHKINFDLQDCDKILRVEGNNIIETKIIEQVSAYGFDVTPL